MKKKIAFHFSKNWKSALTVSLVSIPLAIALTLASGGTPTQGIITAFGAGLLGALLGGSHFNIVGPTGALSGLLITYTIKNGFLSLPIIAVLAGLIILLLYFLRFDKYIIFIPRSVVQGFTLGVAFIIALGQVDSIFGLKNIVKDENVIVTTINILKHYSEFHWFATLLFGVSLIFIILWNKKFDIIPGAIIITLIGIFLVYILKNSNSSIIITTLGDKYPSLHGSLFVNSFSAYSLELLAKKQIWFTSFAVAVIAILETLLSGQIAQNITKVEFDRKKEVFGLAFANIGSGLLGGIPATAALARTALNIKSGAIHRASGLISAVFVAIIAVFFLKYFALLPLAVISAILVAVAIGMIEKENFINFWKHEKISFFLAMFVAVITLAADPIVGILTGTTIALIVFVNKISSAQTEIILWTKERKVKSYQTSEIQKLENIHSDIVVYKIVGMLTYINMPAHLETIKKVNGNKNVILSVRNAFYADTDGVQYLSDLIEVLKKQNEKIILSGVNKQIEKLIEHETFYKNKLIEGKVFPSTTEAINYLIGNQNNFSN